MLLLENMDRRKASGRFAADFRSLFERFPAAGLCLDVAHTRQVDPTLTEGMKFLREFGDRLRELHISEVTSNSAHGRISLHASGPLKSFLARVPEDVPVIVESVLGDCQPVEEIANVTKLFRRSQRVSAR
jgi:sugar phosphate isomerase/epimerase